MRFTTTLVFFFLFVAVAAVYLYLGPKEEKPSRTLPAESMQLLPLEKGENVDWIQIQNLEKNTVITLKKDGDEWKIIHPVSYLADSLIVEGLVTALRLSTKARRFAKDQEWSEYGLEGPVFKIGVQSQKGSEKRYLDLGDPSPVGAFVYARWEDEQEYFLLKEEIKDVFDHTVYSLRQKKVFRSPLKDVSKISIRTSAAHYEMAKLDDRWYWVEPIPILGEKVEKQDLDIVFSQLQHLYVKDFLDDLKNDRYELGLSRMGAMMRLVADPGDEELLLLGKELPARDAFYGMRKGEEMFFLVSRTNLQTFFAQLEAMTEEYITRYAQTAPRAV